MLLTERVLSFGNYINESASPKEVKVVVLSGTNKPSKTSKQFMDVCKKRGLECHIINVNNARIKKIYNGHVIENVQTGEKIQIDPNTTAIVPRRGVISNSHTISLMRVLEDSRYFCVNTIDSIQACENKFTTCEIMEAHGLPVPKYALVPDEKSLDSALKAVGGKFPVVMKLLSGSQGIGVSIVDSYASLKSVYQTIKKLDSESEILIQEKINSDFDLRIQVLIKKLNALDPDEENSIILGAMKRSAVSKDFRTNYSLGGSVEGYDIDDELKEIAFKAATAVGCHWCGVDIMIDSKTNKPYILEVNASPGTEGISKAIDKPIVDDVIDYITKKSNWAFSNLEVGYLENIKIPGIGEMVAKFDTGNGAKSCTIHADEIVKDGEVLNWKIGDREFSSDIVGYSMAEVGDEIDKRPIINLDIEFNAVRVKNVKVSPVDRGEKSTPFLVNRAFMKRLGLIVNPYKAFVATKEPKKGYSPAKAKEDVHGGIIFKESKEENKKK
jgi:ribosomal protein S6--L-glutamate ligase